MKDAIDTARYRGYGLASPGDWSLLPIEPCPRASFEHGAMMLFPANRR